MATRAGGTSVLLVLAAFVAGCPSPGARGAKTERPYTHTISTDDDDAHKDTGAASRHVIGAD